MSNKCVNMMVAIAALACASVSSAESLECWSARDALAQDQYQLDLDQAAIDRCEAAGSCTNEYSTFYRDQVAVAYDMQEVDSAC